MKKITTFIDPKDKEAYETFDYIKRNIELIKDKETISRILAVLLSNNIEEEMAQRGQYIRYGGHPNALRFISHPFGGFKWKHADHYGLMLRGKEFICATFEPYGLSMDAIEELIAWCKAENLRFEIEAESPHFPSRTLLVKVYKTK